MQRPWIHALEITWNSFWQEVESQQAENPTTPLENIYLEVLQNVKSYLGNQNMACPLTTDFCQLFE